MSLIKQKQIAGLSAALEALVQKDTELTSAVGNISLGNPSLDGNTLKIPFTKGDGTTVERSIDLTSLSLDINVQSAVIDQNGNLVITETDGETHTVSILDYVTSYINANVLPQIQTLSDNLDSLTSRVATAEGEIDQLQTDVDAAETAISDLQVVVSGKASQQSVNDAMQAAQDAQTAADTAQTTADNAVQAAQTAQADVDALEQRVEVLESAAITGIDLFARVADNDSTTNTEIVTSFTLPGAKAIVGVFVNGVQYPHVGTDKKCYIASVSDTTVPATSLSGTLSLVWQGEFDITATQDVVNIIYLK